MANRLASFIGGLNIPGFSTENQRLDWYRKYGIEPPPAKPSPLGRAVQWVSDKLGSTSSPATAPGQAPKATDGVGLIERLRAGNIDEYGSEAYNRWGQGKADGDAAELAREAARSTPGSTPVAAPTTEPDPEVMTQEMWDNAPPYAQANPRWEGLPGDDDAIEIGAQA